MSARFEATYAKTLDYCTFVPGEEYGADQLGPDEWAVCLGDPDATALVIVGTRDDVLDALDRARAELLNYYTAEHENGYHLHTPKERCPECCPEEMACPGCSNTENNSWARWSRQRESWGQSNPEGTVICGACMHEWQAFERVSQEQG